MAVLLFAIACTSLTGPTAVFAQERKTALPSRGSGVVARAETPQQNDPDYVIGPSDLLTINVWKEPELSRTVPVRPDGKISLPLIDDIQASGLSPVALAEAIERELQQFMTNPTTTVIVQEANSQRVYVLGEVARPGAYPLVPQMTVLQALATAGGFREFANVKKIFVLRTVEGNRQKYRFNYKDVISGRRPDQDIFLRSGDTIIVP